MLMMLAWQPIESQRLVDILFDPAGQLWVFAGPFGEPGGEIATRFSKVTAIIEPAQLLQTVIVDAARHVVERVSQKNARNSADMPPPPASRATLPAGRRDR